MAYASRKFCRVKKPRQGLCFALVVVALAPLVLGMTAGANTPATDPAEQRIPFKRTEDSATGLLARVVGGLIVAALIGVGGVYLLKRYLPSFYHPTFAGAARIKLLEVRRLTPKTTLFLVELDGVQLLLGQSADRITILYEQPRTTQRDNN